MYFQLIKKLSILALATVFLSTQVYASTVSTPLVTSDVADMSMYELTIFLAELSADLEEEQTANAKESIADSQTTTDTAHEERIKQIEAALNAIEMANNSGVSSEALGWMSTAAVIIGAYCLIATGVGEEAGALMLAAGYAMLSLEVAGDVSIPEGVRVLITNEIMNMAKLYWMMYQTQEAVAASAATAPAAAASAAAAAIAAANN